MLREEFTVANGMLLPDGSLNRKQILARHRHIVDGMYNYASGYTYSWLDGLSAAPPPSAPARPDAGDEPQAPFGPAPPLERRPPSPLLPAAALGTSCGGWGMGLSVREGGRFGSSRPMRASERACLLFAFGRFRVLCHVRWSGCVRV